MNALERLKFGIFEFHTSTGELYREGVLVRLQAQPAQVLRLLLMHAGEVVTREILRQAVWGSETFVDFDRGLNFCIAQIRSALGDSAESPRFVRTLPKRGYQFVAPISVIGQNPALKTSIPDVPAPRPITRRLLVPVFLVVIAAFLTLWKLYSPLVQTHSVIRVAVARFDNETGNADLDRFADGLTDSVVADLTTSSAGHYGVIGNAAILRAPRNQRDLVAIGSSLHAGYVILAQVRRNSSQFYVLAHLIHLPDQTHIAVTSLDCPAEDSLQAQFELARQIVTKFSPHLAPMDNKELTLSPSVNN